MDYYHFTEDNFKNEGSYAQDLACQRELIKLVIFTNNPTGHVQSLGARFFLNQIMVSSNPNSFCYGSENGKTSSSSQ